MDIDGSNLTNLSNDANTDATPDWSPDGERLVFVTNRDGDNEVYTMKTDGTDVVRLTNQASIDGVPRWGLPVPVLTPFGGATSGNHMPTLNWNDVLGAKQFRVQYDTDPGFGAPTENVLNPVSVLDVGPLADGTYYWRVRSEGVGTAVSAYSASDSFVIIPTFQGWVLILLAAAMAGYIWFRL